MTLTIEKWASALVGGALTGSAGDRDIRLLVTRERAEEMWGEWSEDAYAPSGAWLARKRDELKQARRLCRLTRTHVDFQFFTGLFSDDGAPLLDDRPRIRLDSLPWSFFAVGESRSHHSRRGSHQPLDDHERQELEHDRRRQERSAFMEAVEGRER
jgi:hypothetical protein